MWFKEKPSQFSMGQTAQSLTCSIMDKPHTGLDECPRSLLLCFRARNSGLEITERPHTSVPLAHVLLSPRSSWGRQSTYQGHRSPTFYPSLRNRGTVTGLANRARRNTLQASGIILGQGCLNSRLITQPRSRSSSSMFCT